MNIIIRITMVVALSLFASASFAEENDIDKLVHTLMIKSGLKKQIEHFPNMFLDELERDRVKNNNINPAIYEQMSIAAKDALRPSTIYNSVHNHIRINLSENEIKEVLLWLDSPLGRKITQLEEEASTVDSLNKMEAIGQKLLKENMDTARMEKIETLDKSIKASESVRNIYTNLQLAMVISMTRTAEPEKRPSFTEAQNFVLDNMKNAEVEIKQMVLIQFLFTYQRLTDYEIDKYINFAKTKSGQRYHAVTTQAIGNALVQAIRRIGTRMGMRMTGVHMKHNSDKHAPALWSKSKYGLKLTTPAATPPAIVGAQAACPQAAA